VGGGSTRPPQPETSRQTSNRRISFMRMILA